MILPIVIYGNNILRKKCISIENGFNINPILLNMWETLQNSNGIGLAAPQINQAIRLFLVDTTLIVDDFNKEHSTNEIGVKKAFINPEIIEEFGNDYTYNEACLSIPGVNSNVTRKSNLIINYFDENFEQHEEEYSGIAARVIQHEYDHINGKLFIDHIPSLEKRLIKGKLENITKGKIKPKYKTIR